MSISLLGTSVGLLYITKPDGTTIMKNLPNTPEFARKIKLLGVQATAINANLISVGKISIDAVSSTGNVTAVTIQSVNQLDANEAWSGLSASQLATAIAANINTFTPASGIDFTAIAITKFVHIFATSDDGSTPNGYTITVTTSAPSNITIVTTNFAGGASANQIYDEGSGFRFFLWANASAVEGDMSSATEISGDIIMRGTQTSVKRETVTIDGGVISPIRRGQKTYVEVDVESGSTDDLVTINPGGFAEGDEIILIGAAAARVTTLTNSGNIDTAGGTFVTGDYGDAIKLVLWAKGGSGTELYWFEVGRSTFSAPSISTLRTAGIAHTSEEGRATVALETSGTTTFVVETDELLQNLSGTVTLSGNLEYVFSTAGAIDGDIFEVSHQGEVTVGAYTFKVGGITLTAIQALRGGWFIRGRYADGAWRSVILPNFNQNSNVPKIENDQIEDGTIEIQKIESAHQVSDLIIPLSLEAGYMGAHKRPIPYPCTVEEIIIYVTKVIESTDDASVILKDNSGSTMATIVIPGGAAIGNAFTASPSSSNTFAAREVSTIETAKSTPGGAIIVYYKVSRT